MAEPMPAENAGCRKLDLILGGELPDGTNSYLLWRARTHAQECKFCQHKHPKAHQFLSAEVRRLERALAAELDVLRGEYLRESGVISKEALLSHAGVASLNELLLDDPREDVEQVAAALIASLSKAGRSIKQLLTTIHGEGLAWFEVVPNMFNGEEEFAWMECAGLIRQLSKETQHFFFSAVLAAELLPNLAWDQDGTAPKGIDLGVLFAVIDQVARHELKNYLEQNPAIISVDVATQPPSSYPQLDMTHLLQEIRDIMHVKKDDDEAEPSVPIMDDLFTVRPR